VSYAIPQGSRRGLDVDLSDATYDGDITDSGRTLTGGLGQLTDGILGQSNFRVDRHGLRGYEWVGWRRREDPGDEADYVELNFHFDGLRNFSSVNFHTNNQFSRDARVFRAARITFRCVVLKYKVQLVQSVRLGDLLTQDRSRREAVDGYASACAHGPLLCMLPGGEEFIRGGSVCVVSGVGMTTEFLGRVS